jgi:DNA mismatch repair protein MutL
LEDLNLEKTPKEIDFLSKKMIAYLACRGAVKAGDPLTKKQVKDLLEKLKSTNNNTTCPHGRPTKVFIDIERLHRLFKRK